MRIRTITAVILLAAMVAVLATGCSDDEKKDAPKPKASARGADALNKPFVASMLHGTFHKSTCPQVQNLIRSKRGLLGYDTREDALADGKLPCEVCKP